MPWIVAAGAIVAGAMGAKASKDAAKESSNATQDATAENSRQYDITRNDTALSRSVGQGALYKLAGEFGINSPTPIDQEKLNSLKESQEKIKQRLSDARNGKNIPGGNDLRTAGFDSPQEWYSYWENRLNGINQKISSIQKTSLVQKPLAKDAGGIYDNLEMDPGYDFRLSEGEKALQRMQSAGGTRYGGGALRAAVRYGQDYASNEFSNAVNRRNAELGYLFSLAGFGQQGIATAGQAGQNAASNNSNILMQNAANQGAYGIAGASAVNNAVQGGLQNYYTQQLLNDYNRNPYSIPQSHETTH